MRFKGILLEEELSILVMKNEQTLAKQRVKLKDKNQPVPREARTKMKMAYM